MFVLLQDIDRPFRHFGSHWPTGTQHKPGISTLTGLLICKCFSAITREAPGWRGTEAGKEEKQNWQEVNPLCFALPWQLQVPLPPLWGPSSPAAHPCPWCSWIAFHPLQFYTNKAILWSQHSHESLHTFLGWNANCLTSQSKLHNCAQDGIKGAASN